LNRTALFKKYNGTTKDYKNKFRELAFNLAVSAL